MAILTKAPRGTQDVLPAQSYEWQYVEKTAVSTAANFGFREIRVPTFEHTELFCRGVGDTTDVVQKEMYTFEDKGGRSITLKPEGTAGTVRSVIEHGLLGEALPIKTCYVTPCFRYEKPQAGRLREFHQFGVELFGPQGPAADVEVIALARQVLEALQIQNISLDINSIGCPDCRKTYQQALVAYFERHSGTLCETCLGRLQKNPMRILDCKSPLCSEIAAGAPTVLDYICDDCSAHFEEVKTRLDTLRIPYTVNPKIVRGLDYYTKTVFEFVSGEIGAQGTICGGGRYDGLVEQLGGPKMPALGCAMGIERLIMVMKSQQAAFEPAKRCDMYVASMGEAAARKAGELCAMLREEGFYAECDLMGRSLKAQMKYADKLGARFSVVLGDNELETGIARLKNMETGETSEVKLGNELLASLYDADIASTIDSLVDSFGGEFGTDLTGR